MKISRHLHEKYLRLFASQAQPISSNVSNCVINLSNAVLSQNEYKVLQLGLNFAFGKNTPDLPILLSCLEPALQKLNHQSSHRIRTEIAKTILFHRSSFSRSTVQLEYTPLLKSVRNLKANQDIVILRADKGNCVVILNKSDYVSKMYNLLNDDNTYHILKKDPTTSIQNKLNNKIKDLLNAKIIDNATSKKLRCYNSRAPVIYGLPKVHKDSIPLRPIVNFTTSPLFAFSKFLCSCLQPFTQASNHSINSSFSFNNQLHQFSPPIDSYLISLDVIALYPSIPIDFACSSIRNILNSSALPHPFDLDIIIELVEFSMTNNYFTFENKFFKQVSGTAMGSPTSMVIAELVMQDVENKIINLLNTKIYLWKRYVDDVFIITTSEHKDIILSTANSICPKIQFTREDEINNRLNFLDISIYFNSATQSFDTTVYRKASSTGKYLNYHSVSPHIHKFNTLRTLLNRAKRLCSSEPLFKIEVEKIFTDLSSNNYPRKWLKRSYTKIMNDMLQPTPLLLSSTPPSKNYVSIPYYPKLSESISKILHRYHINTTFRAQYKIKSFFRNHLPMPPPYATKNAIYQINCTSCDAAYIGETSRPIEVRIKEHKRTIRNSSQLSKLTLHAMQFNHPPDFQHVKILASGADNYFSRTFLEGWYTSLHLNPINEAAQVPGEYLIIQPLSTE